MRRSPFVLLAVCAALVGGPAAVAGAQSGQSDPPPECFQSPDSTCVQDANGQWRVEPGGGVDEGGGIPDGFVALMVLAGIGAIGFTIWKVSMARRMATEAGMDPGRAMAVTLLTDDGLDAAYIATSLRGRQASEPSSASPPHTSAADRLRELEQLRDDGLVTADEYDARRRAIVESL
jgi:hypothetical protein